MGQVNSYGESRASEKVFGSMRARRGAQLSAKIAGIPGLRRADQQTERLSPKDVLAEGEELWSNPLCVRFQRFSITAHLMK